MSDSKAEVHQDAATPVGKPSKKRSCMRHCGKFWWAYLIVFIIIVVLVVCLVIFVGVPKIAQSKINDAKLEIQNVRILDTESDAFTMEVESTITTDGSVHADIDAFRGDMYLEGADPYVPFASLDFPKTNSDKHQDVDISQSVDITDMDAFTNFNIEFFQKESVDITIKGKTKVKPSGLDRKSKVDFKKTLETKGLNLFKGTTVPEGTILMGKDEEDGKNFKGRAIIPNASHFTLDIGNVSFINFVDDKDIGTLFINDLVLKPGDNDVNVTAVLDQAAVLTAVSSRPYCEDGMVPFKLLGNNVTNNGQNLSYFADALASANQTVPINITAIISSSLGINVECSDK
ncbi:hypothetical protein N3K66_002427 [Trichothecium roseum]|uniref:Uncharacterized protein n=1 Tax=Trichothecium roseum TaxID=47278 RepID=A0ACC0VB69_9HYPO|nr:hypothetical protein N3K66_002427 [Trichothecium roseum]